MSRCGVAAVLITVLLTASCATQTSGTPQTNVDITGSVELGVSSDVQQIRDDVYTFYDSWAGGRSGQRAAEVLISYYTNGPLTECVAEHGYDLSWESTISGTTYWDGLNETRWLRDPLRPRYSQSALADAYSALVEERESQASDVPDEVVEACLKHSSSISESAVLSLSYPPGLERLMAAWDRRIVDATSAVIGDRDQYEQCVLHGDIPEAFDQPEDADALVDAIHAAEPPLTEVPIGSDAPGPAWTEWRAVEHQLLQVEWSCAEPVYEAGMRLLPAVVDEFKEEFGPEIAALTRHWDQVRADAHALGWSENRPFLSMTPRGWVDPEIQAPAPLD